MSVENGGDVAPFRCPVFADSHERHGLCGLETLAQTPPEEARLPYWQEERQGLRIGCPGTQDQSLHVILRLGDAMVRDPKCGSRQIPGHATDALADHGR